MRIRRLGWAGIELSESDVSIAIDPLGTLGFFEEFWGEPDQRDELIELRPNSLAGVLLTHLHRDHADPDTIAAALIEGGVVAGPPRARHASPHQQYAVLPQEDALIAHGIERRELVPGQSLELGPFIVSACQSVDGVGAEQVAWHVRSGDQSLLHCGDTLWHGGFWEIAAEHGPLDVACLPANGVITDFPFNQPTVSQVADLDPEQAVAAAKVLRAGTLIPIHFSRTYDHDPIYRPTSDVVPRLEAAAKEHGVKLGFPAIGEWLELGEELPAPGLATAHAK